MKNFKVIIVTGLLMLVSSLVFSATIPPIPGKVKVIVKKIDSIVPDSTIEIDDDNETVRIGEDLTVVSGDTIPGDAVVINGNLDVLGFVGGDVVCIGGELHISGYVNGDATVIGGNAEIESTAVIDGDLASIGGRISRAKGSKIKGETTSVSLPILRSLLPFAFKFISPHKVGIPYHPYVHPVAKRSIGFGVYLIKVVALIVFIFLIILFFKSGVERVSDAIENNFWKSVLAGFIGVLIIVPLTVLLAVLIIGIPLIPLLWIATIAGMIFGFTSIAYTIGRVASRKKSWNDRSPYILALIGFLVIEIIAFLGHLVALPGGAFAGIGGILKGLGFIISYLAWMIGLGGVILTRFGAKKFGE